MLGIDPQTPWPVDETGLEIDARVFDVTHAVGTSWRDAALRF